MYQGFLVSNVTFKLVGDMQVCAGLQPGQLQRGAAGGEGGQQPAGLAAAVRQSGEQRGVQVRLQLDVFHLQQLEGNITRSLQRFLPLSAHIQVAQAGFSTCGSHTLVPAMQQRCMQVPERGEPDSPGELDYRYIFSQLERLGYTGWVGLLSSTNQGRTVRIGLLQVGLEYKPRVATLPGLAWLEKLGFRL